MAKQDDYTRYTIRIPTPLYERVKAAAGEASVNSLVVATLEERYPPPLTPGLSKLAKAVAKAVMEAVKKGGGDQGMEEAAKDAMLSWLQDPETTDEDREAFLLSRSGSP